MKKHKAVLLFGPPGSGKGTQGKALGMLPGYRHIATGDLFRALDPESDLAKEAKSYSSRGALAPDDLAIRVWEDQVKKWEASGEYVFGREIMILDGIPRNHKQARLMDDNISVSRIIELVIPDDSIIITRLKGRARKEGREDDAREEVIRNRLDVYKKETAETLKFYNPSIIARINGNQSIMGVLADIAKTLNN
ncbi:MAG: nucleoside monophosphate kinase [bacterium]